METQGRVPSLHVKVLVPTSEPGSVGMEEGGPLGLADQLPTLTLCLSLMRQGWSRNPASLSFVLFSQRMCFYMWARSRVLAHSLSLSLPFSFILCLSSGIVYLAKEFEPEKMDPRLTKCVYGAVGCAVIRSLWRRSLHLHFSTSPGENGLFLVNLISFPPKTFLLFLYVDFFIVINRVVSDSSDTFN